MTGSRQKLWLRRCVGWLLALTWLGLGAGGAHSQEGLLSGPKVGETPPGFDVDVATGDLAGMRVNLLNRWKDKPVLIIFWSQVTRPGFGLLRQLDKYARLRQPEGLEVLIVRVSETPEEDKKHARLLYDNYEVKAPAGVTTGGKQGPDNYGLNTDAGMTVLLLDKQHKVLLNQARRAPDRQDFAEVREAIDKLLGPSPVAFP